MAAPRWKRPRRADGAALTPYAALGLAGDDARTWRAGARWQVAPDVSLGLEGTLSESAGAAPEQGVMLRSALRW